MIVKSCPTKTSHVLISQDERERALQELQNAFSLGKLDAYQLETRVSAALEVNYEEELSHLLADLAPSTLAQKNAPAQSTRVIFSNLEHTGDMLLPENFKVLALMGCCTLDLRKARFTSINTHIHLKAIMGSIDIIVPPEMRINLGQTPLFGGISCNLSTPEYRADMPTLHIKALAIFGGIQFRNA